MHSYSAFAPVLFWSGPEGRKWSQQEERGGGEQTRSVLAGLEGGKRDGQTAALLGLGVGDPRHFSRGTHSQPPRLQGAGLPAPPSML